MSKTKKIISLLLTVALIMTMATVAIVTTSAAAKVYFEDSLNWGNITAYCYGGDGEVLGGWPGTPCTDEGDGIWSIEVDGTPSHIIFHANDDANQTSDIPFAGDNMIAKLTGDWSQGAYKMVADAEFYAYEGGNDDPIVTDPTTATSGDEIPTTTVDNTPVVPGETITVYFTNNWAFLSQNVYYWGTDADPEWPGVAMTAAGQNDNGEDVYSAEVPATAAGIIFNGEHDQQPGVIRQTVDITEFANNMGFYCESEDAEGKIVVGTYEYNGGNGDDVTTTTTEEVTTVTAEKTTATTTKEATTVTTTAGGTVTPAETGIVVAEQIHDVPVGTTVTYTVALKADRLFEDIQAVLTYDSTKLELVRKTDDEELGEDEIACPNLEGLIFNADIDGLVKFNATKYKGLNFKEEKVLITLDFIVKDTARNTIDLVIEEMTIKGDGTESYFTGSQAVITEGISVVETLKYDVITTEKTTATTEKTTAEITTATTEKTTAEITTATTEKTTAEITTVTTEKTTAEITTVTETETDADVVTTVPAPSTDPSNVVGTTAEGGVDAPTTGAAAYIYIAIAIMAMVACAVVVLRKKAND